MLGQPPQTLMCTEVLMQASKVPNNRLKGRLVRQKRSRQEHDLGHGTLTISVKHRKTRHHLLNSSDVFHSQDDSKDGDDSMIATVKYLPRTRTGGMFTVSFMQKVVCNGSFSSIPRFQANNVLPRDSLVFELTREGRLCDLITLLSNPEASLRDHDDLGNSLLAVSPKPQVVFSIHWG